MVFVSWIAETIFGKCVKTYSIQKKFISKKCKYVENVNYDDRDNGFFPQFTCVQKGLAHSYYDYATVLLITLKENKADIQSCIPLRTHC